MTSCRHCLRSFWILGSCFSLRRQVLAGWLQLREVIQLLWGVFKHLTFILWWRHCWKIHLRREEWCFISIFYIFRHFKHQILFSISRYVHYVLPKLHLFFVIMLIMSTILDTLHFIFNFIQFLHYFLTELLVFKVKNPWNLQFKAIVLHFSLKYWLLILAQ